MNRLVAAYMIVFLLFSYFSSVAEGGGGTVATNLVGDLTDNATEVRAVTTSGFLSTSSSIIIGDEEIFYTTINGTHFLTCTRGYRGTTAEAHSNGRYIYSTSTGVLNRALGFDVAATNEAYGTLSVIAITLTFLAKAVGYLVTFNFGLLGGQLVYLRYLLMAGAVGFVVYLGFMAMGTAFGIIQKSR